ncbi:MAG: hypothetical protein ABEJ22_05670 [Haloferacaceae archaeon]
MTPRTRAGGSDAARSRGPSARDADLADPSRGPSPRHADLADRARSDRAISDVVGVALLLAITTVSLSVVTLGAGTVVEDHAASASADHVAEAMTDLLGPDGAAGRVAVGDGRLRARNRTVRVLNDTGVVAARNGSALVYGRGDRRVTFDAGAVVSADGDAAALVSEPSVRTGEGVLLVSVSLLSVSRPNVTANRTGSGETVLERVGTTHSRLRLPPDNYTVAVETASPGALARYFDGENATATRRDFDGDGTASVVADFAGRREAYLVVHRVRVEVRDA